VDPFKCHFYIEIYTSPNTEMFYESNLFERKLRKRFTWAGRGKITAADPCLLP